MTTHPQSVFERAVEAAADALVETSGGFGPDDNRVISSAIVRAVLMAVREATDEVLAAGMRTMLEREPDFVNRAANARGSWQAMIDAILAQQEE